MVGNRLFRISAFLATVFSISLAALAVQADETLFRGVPKQKDVEEQLFRSARPTHTIEGERDTNSISIAILFDFDSTDLSPTAKKQLDVVASALSSAGTGKENILIEGHTDASGSRIYNMSLSERRALAVHDYLVKEKGVNPERLVAVGRGEDDPFRRDNPYAAENRRVRFINEGP